MGAFFSFSQPQIANFPPLAPSALASISRFVLARRRAQNQVFVSPCDWRHLSFCDVMRLLSTKLNFPHEQSLFSVSKIASAGMQCISKHGCIIATVMYSINYYSSRRNARCPRDIVYRISCSPYMHMGGRLVDFCGRYHPHPFLRKRKGELF